MDQPGLEAAKPVVKPPSLIFRRWLVSYDHLGREQVSEVPENAYVMTEESLLKALGNSGDVMIETDKLAGFAVAIVKRLADRANWHRSRHLALKKGVAT